MQAGYAQPADSIYQLPELVALELDSQAPNGSEIQDVEKINACWRENKICGYVRNGYSQPIYGIT